MSIPNGLAPHYLWRMDGRTWIESSYASGEGSAPLARAIERGWATPIPSEALSALVSATMEDIT